MSNGSPGTHASASSALLDLAQQLLTERDAVALMRRVCAVARELTGARVAGIGIAAPNGGRIERVITDASSPAELTVVAPLEGTILRQIEMRKPVRATYKTAAEPQTTGTIVVAPFATAHHVYGWLALLDSPDGFRGSDEQIAMALGGLAGTAYENATLVARDDDTEFALSVARIGLSYRDLDADDIVVSRSLADLLGLPPGTRSIARVEFLTRVHPDDAAHVDRTVKEAVAQGTEFDLEYRLHAGDRGWRWFRSNGRVRVNMQGRPRVFSGIADVTERRLLESQLHQAQKMEALGQLAGGVAHDFNNFMTAILGYGRFLMESVPDQEQRLQAEEIVKAAERAASLTKQLLAFGRRQVMETAILDANALVADMADMLRRLIGEQVELTTSLAAELPTIKAGRGQLEQVLMNLVVNARDAIDGRGAIRIETQDVTFDLRSPNRPIGVSAGKCVMVAVSDTGRGMTEETKARLFEPFFTTKSRAHGSGLGLATVYGIVTQCGGSIAVTSEPGHGSTFRVYLPRHEPPVHEPAAPPTATVTRGAETVLLAEDEPAVRRLARLILERAGYTVVDAANPGDAETVAESLPHIDLLLTDVVMPGGTGPDLFRRLAARRPSLRVLFMSGYAERDLFDRETIAKTDAFLAKPFSAESLVTKVRQILDH